LVELVSVQGLPYFLIRKIQIKGVLWIMLYLN
jgi:hypothetical protein